MIIFTTRVVENSIVRFEGNGLLNANDEGTLEEVAVKEARKSEKVMDHKLAQLLKIRETHPNSLKKNRKEDGWRETDRGGAKQGKNGISWLEEEIMRARTLGEAQLLGARGSFFSPVEEGSRSLFRQGKNVSRVGYEY
ncbi:hypothetical protein K0M31_011903 [Melipona bicolor]|uniref:Uncharacterized protein n=1 Tax=Melipona bicolor TaxID=60889 RepID=A0AA40KV69_9HYME|nr:hypothetical protein K0M31_011903 [Melipona bicolor]